jgi:carboxyl-terminal processing protease
MEERPDWESITPEIFMFGKGFSAFDRPRLMLYSRVRSGRSLTIFNWKELKSFIMRPNFLALIALFAAIQLVAQTPDKRLSAKQIDPFDISSGQSFFASNGSVEPPKTAAPNSVEIRRIMSELSEALQIIRTRHVAGDRIDMGSVSKSTIGGALQSLDPHSSFFSHVEFLDLMQEQQSEYSGIGASIASFRRAGRMGTYVTSTVPGSPAALAGLKFGDRIIEVDGEDYSGRSADEVRDAIRGESGTRARVVVERASTGRKELIEIRRRLVPQPSIRDSFVLPRGVGYIAMTEGFSYTTADELAASLRLLHKEKINGLIIDLRNNPGGILEQAVRVAEKFLPAGSLIVTQRGRSRYDNRVWRSGNRQPETLPLILLVDENTASASEIVAGALQDHDRALIAGERTFGKGLVQSVFDAPYGTGLTLTTARYFTPSGRSLQRDYADGSLYDYFSHRTSSGNVILARTSSNRAVYGGEGIDPDEQVASPAMNQIERKLNDLAFFFSVEAIKTNVEKSSPVNIRYSGPNGSSTSDSVVDDNLISEFERFAAISAADGLTQEVLNTERSFIVERLTYYLTLAQKGERAANRQALSNDPPVQWAMSHLQRAKELASSTAKSK